MIVGSGLGGQLFHEEQILGTFERGFMRTNPISVPRVSPNAVGQPNRHTVRLQGTERGNPHLAGQLVGRAITCAVFSRFAFAL